MSFSAGHRTQKIHILNFFHDNDNGSALTFLVNGIRFHVYIDYDRLKSSAGEGNDSVDNYSALIHALKGTDQDDQPQKQKTNQQSDDPDTTYGSSEEQGSDIPIEDVYCICRGPDKGFMIGCDGCDEWFHGECVGVTEDQKDSIDSYICPSCKAGDHNHNTRTKKASSHDSGVVMEDDKQNDDPEESLQQWILSFFVTEIENHTHVRRSQDVKTVHEWYNPETKYYALECKDNQITPVELEGTPELQQRMDSLIPKLNMPKYILNFGLPWINAEDLEVVAESTSPEPIHPSIVRHGSDVYFLKVVDPSQPGPTKREIKMMKDIENLGLRDQIKVPQVLGLVGFGNTKTEILGFLQTNIEAAEPLTHMLESDIPQEKRDKWASESERMVGVLHENNFVWGDAKADNFMVDKNEKLWIIDFGGSYTEGWIDPELNETEEGDDMGTIKIVNALHDPDANTIELDDGSDDSDKAGAKRKHDQVASNQDEDHVFKKSKAF